MTDDITTTPAGRGRANARSGISHPGMMGDGTEEQNLNEIGDPSARIGEAEVNAAFGSGPTGQPRSFLDKGAAADLAGKAKDATAEKLSALTDKVNAMRDQVQQSADAAREWAVKQAGSAKDAAQQLHEEKPLLVLSVSAGAALAVGLLAGFIVGRATADDY
jgi:ElaB/YqjD/DUF883 family membrane-anchored ribosome-binding protein